MKPGIQEIPLKQAPVVSPPLPRLRRWSGQWECFSAAGSCLGETPAAAFVNWLRLSLARYDFA